MAGDETTFDYLIVGGGSSGCVLANRLTADGTNRVLLLEAGKRDRHPFIHIPAGFAKLTAGAFEWGYKTVPQRHAADRQVPIAQGKVIGGGGAINAHVFTRGTPNDYDGWARDHGCEGWGFSEVQRYFLRSEGNSRLGAPWHGQNGPLGVSDIAEPNPLTLAFVESGIQFGLPHTTDFNGESQHGVGVYQTMTRNARRSSTGVGYLRPALKRPNLSLKTEVHATRIVLDGTRAVGVDVLENGSIRRYTATKEILVTSGGIGSPKLLMLSGIGDPDHLKEVGVGVKVALPGIGKNLQDHCDLDIIYEVNEKLSLDQYDSVSPKTAWALVKYLTTKSGPMASTVVEGGAFGYADTSEPTPDLQFHFLPASGAEAGVAPVRTGYGCTLNSYHLRPRSRGTVRLASADPMAAPLIDPNYLADDYDLEISVEGVRQCREIMAQPALARYVVKEHYPGTDKIKSEDDLISYTRTHGRTSYHPVGTCKMGSGDDSVVTPDLRVRGVDGLRVCDSSVMPTITSSNTQAPTVMIAEKASDMILGVS